MPVLSDASPPLFVAEPVHVYANVPELPVTAPVERVIVVAPAEQATDLLGVIDASDMVSNETAFVAVAWHPPASDTVTV